MPAPPSPCDTASSEGSGSSQVFARLIANHLHLASFESTPEVRALPSTGVTRLQRYYGPVRLPPEPPPYGDVEAATLARDGSPPITRITLPTCRAHYPGGSNGCMRRLLPRSLGLPRYSGGSASTSSLSRPAQASLALRPAGSLNRPRRPLSRGFGPAELPKRTARQLPDQSTTLWVDLPPLVIRAVGAHVELRMGAVAWAIRRRPVSHPRSSNRTGRFPASGFPTGFTVRHTTEAQCARV